MTDEHSANVEIKGGWQLVIVLSIFFVGIFTFLTAVVINAKNCKDPNDPFSSCMSTCREKYSGNKNLTDEQFDQCVQHCFEMDRLERDENLTPDNDR